MKKTPLSDENTKERHHKMEIKNAHTSSNQFRLRMLWKLLLLALAEEMRTLKTRITTTQHVKQKKLEYFRVRKQLLLSKQLFPQRASKLSRRFRYQLREKIS